MTNARNNDDDIFEQMDINGNEIDIATDVLPDSIDSLERKDAQAQRETVAEIGEAQAPDVPLHCGQEKEADNHGGTASQRIPDHDGDEIAFRTIFKVLFRFMEYILILQTFMNQFRMN